MVTVRNLALSQIYFTKDGNRERVGNLKQQQKSYVHNTHVVRYVCMQIILLWYISMILIKMTCVWVGVVLLCLAIGTEEMQDADWRKYIIIVVSIKISCSYIIIILNWFRWRGWSGIQTDDFVFIINTDGLLMVTFSGALLAVIKL